MSINRTVATDGAIALLLALALGVVFLIDRHRAGESSSGVTLDPPRPREVPPLAPPLRLAVTPRQYDDMGKLLSQLGTGFRFSEIPLEALEDVSRLVDLDVIFLTCGTVPRGWVIEDNLGAGDRPGVRRARLSDQVVDRVRQAIRDFVGRGGTIYASDWRLDLIRMCFPEFFVVEEIVPGAAQTLTAEVVDPGLRDVLGPEVELKFDLPGWKPALLSGDGVVLYLRGSYGTTTGSRMTAPLLAKVPFQKGTIIFTSFHNEKVNSDVETKLLRYLVFAAVTARETAEAQKAMISGGFSPQKESLLSASSEAPSVTQTYTNTRRRQLRFVLGFANRGATLRLVVRGPDGHTFEQEGISTFTVDVPDAAEGDWSYTVTAKRIPYPNFPFTLTVGGE